jgi:hypothetical protein|tara:strand:- start:166 stop:573 length:408 start_codon:yes stop_codon:yes gene_type:complete
VLGYTVDQSEKTSYNGTQKSNVTTNGNQKSLKGKKKSREEDFETPSNQVTDVFQYENKIYFKYLMEKLEILCDRRVHHPIAIIKLLGKKVSFFGLFSLHNREEISVKRMAMIEEQIKLLYKEIIILRDENGGLRK